MVGANKMDFGIFPIFDPFPVRNNTSPIKLKLATYSYLLVEFILLKRNRRNDYKKTAIILLLWDIIA
jgi:hypothetical protein